MPALASDDDGARRIHVGAKVDAYVDPGEELLFVLHVREGQTVEIRAYVDDPGSNAFRAYRRVEFGRLPVEMVHREGIAFTAPATGDYEVEITRESGHGRMRLIFRDPEPLVELSFTGVAAIGYNSRTDYELLFSLAAGVGHAGFDLVGSTSYDFQASRVLGIAGVGYRFGDDPFELPYLRLALGLGYALDMGGGALPVAPLGFGARIDWVPSAADIASLFEVDTHDRMDTEAVGLALSMELQVQEDEFVRFMFGMGFGF